MSEVTQKICDGCGVAGKKGEPTYGMRLSLYAVKDHVGDPEHMTDREVDVHANSRCIKSLLRQFNGQAEALLQETL